MIYRRFKLYIGTLAPFLIVLLFLFVIVGCRKNYTPLPEGFLRISPSNAGYRLFSEHDFPLVFEVPMDVDVVVDSSFVDGGWINLVYERYNAVLYCTYLKVDTDNVLEFLEESRDLIYVHASKANDISVEFYKDSVLGVKASVYRLFGNVATPLQFMVSDGRNFILRGSLYFNSEVNSDSIAPIADYVKQDAMRIIESLKRR